MSIECHTGQNVQLDGAELLSAHNEARLGNRFHGLVHQPLTETIASGITASGNMRRHLQWCRGQARHRPQLAHRTLSRCSRLYPASFRDTPVSSPTANQNCTHKAIPLVLHDSIISTLPNAITITQSQESKNDIYVRRNTIRTRPTTGETVTAEMSGGHEIETTNMTSSADIVPNIPTSPLSGCSAEQTGG
jgi:hypothetical protein